VQTRKIAPLPVVLVGEAYWRRVFDPEVLVDEGMIDLEDRELFCCSRRPPRKHGTAFCAELRNRRAPIVLELEP